MIYFNDTTQFYTTGPTAVTLGKFDGLHRGHAKLLNRIREDACGDVTSVVFTLNPKKEALILTNEEQKDLIEEMGIDCLVRCPFVPEIYTMTPGRFVREILIGALHASHVVIGTDFRFGYQRAGDAAFLQESGEAYGFQVTVMEKELYEGREISSTYVREALDAADLPLAAALMGRQYCIHGTVLHGQHLGTRLGMPTLNLIPGPAKLLPPDGVYFSRTYARGHVRESITDIGTKPTVGAAQRGVETYLLDTCEDLYDEEIRVDLLSFVRPEKKFDSVQLLKEQIERDVREGREYFREHGGLEE